MRSAGPAAGGAAAGRLRPGALDRASAPRAWLASGGEEHAHGVARLDRGHPLALAVEQMHAPPPAQQCTTISAARRWAPSSSMARSTCSAALSSERTMPRPWQCGQVTKECSVTEGRSRWRDISSRPKWEIRPTWMRARSKRSASFSRRSTMRVVARRLHVDEVDHDQPREVAQAQLAARSRRPPRRLVRSAVSSMCRSRVARPEFTSMATSASVWLMTMVAARAELHASASSCASSCCLNTAPWRRAAPPGRGTGGSCFSCCGISMRMKSRACRQASSPSTWTSSMSRREVVADRPLDEVGFLVDQRGRGRGQRALADLVPQPQQVLAVALDLRLGPLRAGGADDDAHPPRQFHLVRSPRAGACGRRAG